MASTYFCTQVHVLAVAPISHWPDSDAFGQEHSIRVGIDRSGRCLSQSLGLAYKSHS